MENIENYDPTGNEVLGTDRFWVELHFEVELPRVGEAVVIESGDGESVHASVRQHLGGHRVKALLLGPVGWLSEGMSAARCERPAGIELPEDGGLELTPNALIPRPDDDTDWFPLDWREPEFGEIAPTRPALETGYEGIDTIAPLTAGGINLLIDAGKANDALASLAERCRRELDAPSTIRLGSTADDGTSAGIEIETPRFQGGRAIALRVATALAAHRRQNRRDTLLVASLPEVTRTVGSQEDTATAPGYGEIVDLLGSGLVSTNAGRITALLHLRIPESRAGIASIVETLDLGDVEAQIFVDEDGRFDPFRSTSDANLSEEQRRRQSEALSAFRRAEAAREKRRLFGDVELDNTDHNALQTVNSLRDELG